ncbi:membrane protein [Spirochaetia bacterium]|nr:membrane protein [Spirochaetia bacterium]
MARTAQPGSTNGSFKTIAILGAFCLFLSTIEYLIPKPAPFMRLGIANLPLMLALDIVPFSGFLLLIGIKVIGQGIITGTLFSYILLFSLAGTGVSALTMFFLRRFLGPERISLVGISVLGALLSNGAQLGLARVFIFGQSVRYITPPFLAMGLITSLALGLFCEYFIRGSRWYAGNRRVESAFEDEYEAFISPSAIFPPRAPRFLSWEQFRQRRQDMYENLFGSSGLCVAGLLMMPALVFNPNPYFRTLQFMFFWFLAALGGKRNNPLTTILIILGITAFNLLAPYGRVLFSWGLFRITEGALLAGIQRGVTLEGLIMLSRIAIRRDLRLPGVFGELIGESFRILKLVQERRNTITRKNFVRDIDNLLIELSGTEELPPAALKKRRPTTAVGWIILCAAVILAWLPWLWGASVI